MTQGKSETVEYFLRIEIHLFTENGKRAFRMTQYGLINNIINTCGIMGCNYSTINTAVQSSLVTFAMKKLTKYQYQWIFIRYHHSGVCYKQVLSK